MNDPVKWPLILNKIDECGAHVVCFQETKRTSFDLSYIRNFCEKRLDSLCYHSSNGRSGGLLTVWCSSSFDGVAFS